jgi:hypothetical protein
VRSCSELPATHRTDDGHHLAGLSITARQRTKLAGCDPLPEYASTTRAGGVAVFDRGSHKLRVIFNPTTINMAPP